MFCVNGVQAADYTLTDQKNDVYYQPGGGEQTQTDIDTQPNIDIQTVSYSTDAGTVAISITVLGTIQDSIEQNLYYGHYESADAKYQFTFSNNNINAMIETGDSKGPAEATPEVDGNTLTVSFSLATDDTSLVDLYAYGHYYENPDSLMMGPKYVDTTTDIENTDPSDASNQDDSTGDDSTGPQTPGFTFIILLTAGLFILAAAYKKKN